MIAGLGAVDLAIVFAITASGAIVQGSAGIGLGLVAGPVLLQLDNEFAPGPLLLGGVVIGSRHVAMEWRDLDRTALRRSAIGLPLGMIAGLLVLRWMEADTLAILIGASICVASLALLSGARIRPSPDLHMVTGAAAAFSSVTAAIPGPPLAIGWADLPPRSLRSTVSVFVMVTSAVALLGLAWIDRFGRHEAGLLAIMVPGLIVGVLASRWTRPLLDRTWFRPAVLVISLAGGLALLIDQF